MFDSARDRVVFLPRRPAAADTLVDADTLRERCVGSAARWVMRRRAHLPHCGPSRLPAVARGG